MNKIVEGLESALASAKCDHQFVFLRQSKIGVGVTARCAGDCQCTFTAWPGSLHYDEIIAARDLQKPVNN